MDVQHVLKDSWLKETGQGLSFCDILRKHPLAVTPICWKLSCTQSIYIINPTMNAEMPMAEAVQDKLVEQPYTRGWSQQKRLGQITRSPMVGRGSSSPETRTCTCRMPNCAQMTAEIPHVLGQHLCRWRPGTMTGSTLISQHGSLSCTATSSCGAGPKNWQTEGWALSLSEGDQAQREEFLTDIQACMSFKEVSVEGLVGSLSHTLIQTQI